MHAGGPAGPNSDIESEWRLSETVVTVHPVGLRITVWGGSDNGQFAYIGNVEQEGEKESQLDLHPGDILLQIQRQNVAGYTQRDVQAWLNHCCKSGNPITISIIPKGVIKPELRSLLACRYPKGSGYHELQNIIRDNVYLRTVPVTTRPPRQGEVDGLDYAFLSIQQFMLLERNGNLLESGIYEGNHYGTPKPSREAIVSGSEWYMPGAHPSSEGKRRRNRSNVEAMSAKDMEPLHQINSGGLPNGNGQLLDEKRNNTNLPCYVDTGEFHYDESMAELGPLPANWEQAYTEKGEVYFIDHNTGTSHWLDPRLSKIQKKSLKECLDDELPYGWEKIEDPDYGTYYIDHVNRTTQYENPVIVAKRSKQQQQQQQQQHQQQQQQHQKQQQPEQSLNDDKSERYSSFGKPASDAGSHDQTEQYPPSLYEEDCQLGMRQGGRNFTRNPAELQGETITCVLVKSSRGLGFTIVGGDENADEFLQIKSVVPNGPAWLDGKLRMGDVLVYVNDVCLLGFTHLDMVNVFQSIAPGETVKLQVCRGYPLPFDPNDPNTEVVTTVAVGRGNAQYVDEPNIRSDSDEMLNNSVKSMPDLCASEKVSNMHRPSSTDVLLDDRHRSDYFNEPPAIPEKPEFLTIAILKGPMGFGFTIADSAYGQKVKKILDRLRCKNLMEGDILVEINGMNVRNMCHADVVQLLKDCERNQQATVTVQRGANSPNKQQQQLTPLQPPLPNSANSTLYRSNTPTADLYSTQPKENLPARPKTPLVDTRGRSNTPQLHPWNNHHLGLMYQQELLHDRFAKANLNDSQNYQNHYHNHNSKSDFYNRLNQNDDLSFYNGYENGGEYNMYDGQQYGRMLDDRIMSTYGCAPMHGDNGSVGASSNANASARLNARGGSLECVETVVTLVRQETGFGFRIVGGTEEASQVGAPVSIGHIVPGGAADVDGRLCTGDEIVSVDNESVVNTSHHHVVQLMGKAGLKGTVTIGIRRTISAQSDAGGTPVTGAGVGPGVGPNRSIPGYPYDVTVTRMEDEGFGFVIISSLNRTGSTIGRIIKGSPAERCGELHVGDHILAVNHFDISNLHHGDIVNLIKDSGFSVTLTIGPPADDASSIASHSHREDLEADEGYEGGRGRTVPGGSGVGGEDDQYHAVELNRGNRGFGFSIRGGREFHNMPLYVLQIADNGPAAVNDKLKIGDQIIEINGINTKNMTHAEAIEIIRKGGPSVRLLVRRGEKPPPPPPPPSQAHTLPADY